MSNLPQFFFKLTFCIPASIYVDAAIQGVSLRVFQKLWGNVMCNDGVFIQRRHMLHIFDEINKLDLCLTIWYCLWYSTFALVEISMFSRNLWIYVVFSHITNLKGCFMAVCDHYMCNHFLNKSFLCPFKWLFVGCCGVGHVSPCICCSSGTGHEGERKTTPSPTTLPHAS